MEPENPWIRTGTCDGCVGRFSTAWCCTSIDAGSIFANLTLESRNVLKLPTKRKVLRFGDKLEWDFVRFCRLHGLDGETDIHIGESDKDAVSIPIRIMLRTHKIEIWSPTGIPFRLDIPQDDDVKFVIQIPCREYNYENRQCNIYGKRPKVCKDFPIHPQQLVNSPCAYHFEFKERMKIQLPDGKELEMKPLGR